MPESMGQRGGGGSSSAALMRFCSVACKAFSTKAGTTRGLTGSGAIWNSASSNKGLVRPFGFSGGSAMLKSPQPQTIPRARKACAAIEGIDSSNIQRVVWDRNPLKTLPILVIFPSCKIYYLVV